MMESCLTDRSIAWQTYDPHWTEIEHNPGGGRDFLGIETMREASWPISCLASMASQRQS